MSGKTAFLLAFVALCPTTSSAQSITPPSPINEMLQQARNHINRFRYDSALTITREVLGFRSLRREQSNAAYQLMAAVFFPEEGGTVRPDSASWYMGRAVRTMPDAPLDPAIKWAGLDSLFRATRANTFAAAARVQEDNALTGVDGRAFVDVVSTRPASMTLQSIARSGSVVVTHDSTINATRARLGLRAHSGQEAHFVNGDYEIRVIVRDIQTASADTIRYRAMATGTAPVLQSIPGVPPGALKPERSGLARAKGIAAGLLIGGATYALSEYARAEAPVRDAVKTDARATNVGILIGVGAIVGGFLDKGRPIPENIAANMITKSEAERVATNVRDANRKAAAEYKVELRIVEEIGR